MRQAVHALAQGNLCVRSKDVRDYIDMLVEEQMRQHAERARECLEVSDGWGFAQESYLAD